MSESQIKKEVLIYLLIISQFYCMMRTFHIRNIIRHPQTSRHSNEKQGLHEEKSEFHEEKLELHEEKLELHEEKLRFQEEKLRFHEEKLSELKQTPDTNSFNQLISMLKNLIQTNTSNKIIQERPKQQYQLEVRDREVCIDLPTISPTIDLTIDPAIDPNIDLTINDKKKSSELKLWITDVVKTIISTAFNSYSKNQMSYEQAKIYCSENIFKNIVRFSQKYCLSDKNLELIDKHIKDGVLKYLAAKYPQIESTLVNMKLQAKVLQTNNIESLDNNYFKNSQIAFEYRKDGIYNDLIMEMLNDLMNMLNVKYQDFEKTMSDIFQNVHEKQTNKSDQSTSLNQGTNQKNQESQQEIKEREKYRATLKEYTHYQIGRKLSENTPLFTKAEIKDKKIQIKSPQILRILTKWCEELQEKYEKSYFSSRQQSVNMQKSRKVCIISTWRRKQLDNILKDQKQIISQTKEEIFKNNYEMQASVLQNELERQGDEHIDKIEKISGKFSHKVVKNLHSHIIIYLNKLIHGLLNAAIKLFDQYDDPENIWTSPPNLLSFKIGDLMRCKCSSKEQEILRIYQKITTISSEASTKLKIIRVKNRLRTANNDILMNVRFNDSFLCEIQLAIKTTASEFIKCSNKFNHYLYELKRSLFGPLTQLGSIWNSLDQRADIYQQLVKQQQEPEVLSEHACQKLNKNYEMNPYDKSFVCSSCKLSYFHNRFIMSHVQCSTCSYIICVKCRIKQQQAKTNFKGLLGNQQKFIDVRGKIIQRESELPNFGLCVFIESNQPKVQPFTLISFRDIDYLLRKQSGISQISSIRSQKEKAKFRNNFLLFEIKSGSNLEPIKQQQAINKYILPMIMRQNYKKSKETISLMDMELSNEECSKFLSVGSQSQKSGVKNMYLSNNKLTELPFDPKQFSNVEWITLSNNRMESSLKGIDKIAHLSSLTMFNCDLDKFPEVFNCQKLKKLNLKGNQISQIDDRIINLTNLEELDLQNNNIKSIPQGIGKLTKLLEISLAKNQFNFINCPNLSNCCNLKTLNISKNALTSIPAENIEGLVNLEVFNCSNNKLTALPTSLTKLKQLIKLNAGNNQLKTLFDRNFQFDSTSYWPKLSNVDLNNNNLQAIPLPLCYCKKLEILYMRNNKIKLIPPEIKHSSQIKKLVLQINSISEIPNELSLLTKLQYLDLDQNLIVRIPSFVQKFINLTKFFCDNWTIKQIQCLDWMLNNRTRLGYRLIEIAENLKNPPSDVYERENSDQDD